MNPAAKNTKVVYVPTANSGSRTLLGLATLFLFIGGLGLVVLLQTASGQSFDLRRAASETKTCNETCSRNAECQPNHFCSQNKCRLATNPSSEVCAKASPSPAATAKATAKPTASPKTQLKGGPDATLSGELEPTPSPATAGGTVQFSPTPKPSPVLEPLPSNEQPVIEKPGVLGSIIQTLSKLGTLFVYLVLGALVLGLVFLVLFILSRMRRKPMVPPATKPPTPSTSNEQYEQELQAKLDALKQQQTTPAVVEPAPLATVQPAPVMVTEPKAQESMSPPPSAMTPPPMAAPVEQPAVEQPIFEQPVMETPVIESPTADETPVFTRSSSMMARIREKGINPPKPTAE